VGRNEYITTWWREKKGGKRSQSITFRVTKNSRAHLKVKNTVFVWEEKEGELPERTKRRKGESKKKTCVGYALKRRVH